MFTIFFDCKTFDVSDITNIHKYLMKKTWDKMINWLIKFFFDIFLTSIVSTSSYIECMSLTNQKCMTDQWV